MLVSGCRRRLLSRTRGWNIVVLCCMAGVVVVVFGFYRNRYPFKVQLRAPCIPVDALIGRSRLAGRSDHVYMASIP